MTIEKTRICDTLISSSWIRGSGSGVWREWRRELSRSDHRQQARVDQWRQLSRQWWQWRRELN